MREQFSPDKIKELAAMAVAGLLLLLLVLYIFVWHNTPYLARLLGLNG